MNGFFSTVRSGRRVNQRWFLYSALCTALMWPGMAPLTMAQSDEPALTRAMEISDAFKAVAREAKPSVARITGYTAGGAKVTGSGFVIDNFGHLLTNNHIVEPSVSLLAEFGDGRMRPATLVGADPLTDLAVIKVDDEGMEALPFATSNELEVGEWVVAVGFPLGLDQTVTVGVISAMNRHLNIVGASVGRRGYEDFIQTDAAINHGNSGGPLLNLRGEVVGVNAAIVTQTGGSDGLGFAIPTSLAKYIARELISKGRVVRAWLGIDLQDLTPSLAASYGLRRDQAGVLLTSVSPEYPAGRAGLLREDILTSIDGKPVLDVEDLRTQIAMLEPGKRILVEVYRGGKLRNFDVVLAEMPATNVKERVVVDPQAGGRLGLRLDDLSERSLRNLGISSGVVVAQLVPGKSAQLSGISDGDIIVAIDGQPLSARPVGYNGRSSAKWLYDYIEQAKAGSIVRFTVRRGVADAAGRIVEYDPTSVYVAIELQ